jgi:Domain of unknown function (DUF4177)
MPTVTCPACGERGKIGTNLFGSRIKCKKCAASFQVMAPAAKPAQAGVGVARALNPSGIEVEGLDASSWSLSTEVGDALQAQAVADPAANVAAVATADSTPGAYEYKLLTPRDKFFDGRFDLLRLEEALNHYGRQGWSVKAMSTPHVKGFSGALEEFIVVVLER